MAYDVADVIRQSITFTDLAGTATDPTTVTVAWTAPDGTATTKTYGTDPEVVKDSTGAYHIDLTVDAVGVWEGTWTGTGTVALAETFEFTVGPDALDVVSLAEAKAQLRIGPDDTGKDDRLASFITAVSHRLDSLVGPIVARTVTDELHDGGRSSIELRYRPVLSVTTVTEYDTGGADTDLTAETYASKPAAGYLAERYRFDPTLLSGVLRRRAGGAESIFAYGDLNVVVTYRAGRARSTAAVDPRYKQAAHIMLANLWRSQEQSVAGIDEYDLPNQTFPRFAVPNAVRELLRGEWQEAPGFA